MSVSLLKQLIHVYCQKLPDVINDIVKNKILSDILKNAEITLSYKKNDKGNKVNYEPVNTYSDYSKVLWVIYTLKP